MTERPANESIYSFSLISYIISRIGTRMASQMISIAVGMQIYELSHSVIYLGLVGLVQFIPMIFLMIFTGYIADHFDRKIIIGLCNGGLILCFLLLALGSFFNIIHISAILIIAFLMGVIDAFYRPAMQSLLPDIVLSSVFPKAAALNASSLQIATIIGPALGGLFYAFGAYIVYVIALIFASVSGIMIIFVKISQQFSIKDPVTIKNLFAGLSYIRSRPAIFGAVLLDFFAVLFGGATALLPVYASDILFVGAKGLGVLRAAPAAGALIISIYLAHKPIEHNIGISMLIAIICFGSATIVFALSRSFILSIAALGILGMSDVISVVIRFTLVQLQTPNEMRGRVSAVSQIFGGTSNQIGQFESGLTASLFGTVPAVLIGGISTVAVALLWMKLFPALKKMDTYS